MHVAFMIYGSLQEVSGGFLYDRQLVDRLRDREHQVTPVSLSWRPYLHSLRDNLSTALFRRLMREDVDVIVQDHLVHPSCTGLNYRLRGAGGPPVVALVHLLRMNQADPAWVRPWTRAIERAYLRSADGFICVNPHIATRIRQIQRRPAPSVVAPPGADHVQSLLTDDAIVARARQPGALRIAFVGNLTPLKGLHRLLDVLSEVSEPWTLTVLGSLERDPAYVRRIRERLPSMQGHVELRGLTAPKEVEAVLGSSDVFALPSNPESHSIAYLEAMSLGLPILADARSDSADLVEEGDTGWLLRPGEIHAAAARLSEVARNRERLAAMSLRSRRHHAAMPGWRTSMDQAVDFLETHSRRA